MTDTASTEDATTPIKLTSDMNVVALANDFIFKLMVSNNPVNPTIEFMTVVCDVKDFEN